MNAIEALIPLVAVISIFVVLPWMFLHYGSKRREAAKQGAAGQPASAELGALAERLEKRVQALETILDAEVPGWRNRLN